MKRLLIVSITFLLIHPLLSQSWDSDKAKKDFELLIQGLTEIHPGLDRYRTNGRFETVIANEKNQLKEVDNPFSFYQLIAKLLADINCGHTLVQPNEKLTQFLQVNGRFLPILPYVIDTSLYVRLNGSRQAFPIEGDRIISINGISSKAIIKDLLQHLPSDGDNTTGKIQTLNQDFFAFIGYYHLLVDQQDQFEMVWESKESKRIKKNTFKAFDIAAIQEHLTARPNLNTIVAGIQQQKAPDIQVTPIPARKSAILKISGFNNYEQQSKQILAAFEQFKKDNLTALILDLRDNSGGLDQIGVLLFRLLIQEPTHYLRSIRGKTKTLSPELYQFIDRPNLVKVLLQKHIRSKRLPPLPFELHPRKLAQGVGLQKPHKLNFKGRLMVLVNGGTDSAAAALASLLFEHQRGIFIGSAVGGAYQGGNAYSLIHLNLPYSQLTVQIPLMQYQLAVQKNRLSGTSFTPQYKVRYEMQDVLENKDLELLKAVELLANTNTLP